MYEILLQIPEVPKVAGDDVNAILVWIIGTLLAFAVGLIVYFRMEIATLRKDLTAERAYSRAQDNKNIEMIANTTNVLEQNNKVMEKIYDHTGGIKEIINIDVSPIIRDNNERLKMLSLNR